MKTVILLLLGLEGRISKNISFNTSYRKVFDNYFDLARVSQIRYLKDNQMTSEPQNYLSYSALADEIFRAGINYNFMQAMAFIWAITRSNIVITLTS